MEGHRHTAVLYARVSTRGQAEDGYSLRQQMEALQGWAEAEGYEVLEVVEDAGHSGASLERPGLERVRDLVAAGGVSMVVAQDRDRLAREPAYLYLLKQEFAEHGTKIRALNDRGDDTPEGELTDGILDQLAKYERVKLAERSRRNKLKKVREGKIIKGSRPPFGFLYTEDGGGLVVDEQEMAVVRRVFEMLGARGLTMGEVQRRLNEGGVPSPMADVLHQEDISGLWHRSTIRRLVLGDLYRPHRVDELEGLIAPEVLARLDPAGLYGLWTWGKVAAPIPLSEAGLSRAHVDSARERISGNERRPASTAAERFWQLSGGIVRCGECGSVLSPKSRRRPSGKIDSWYMCRQRHSSLGDCTHTRTYRADVLEQAVWQAVYRLISDPHRLLQQYEEHLERTGRRMLGDPDREVRDLAGQLEKLDQKEDYLLEVASDTSMPQEKLRAKLGDFEERRKELQRALWEAQGRQDALRGRQYHMAHLNSVLLQLNRNDLSMTTMEDRRRLYGALQLRVVVDTEGTIRLSGIFDPDVYLPGVLEDPLDWLSPRPEVPEETEVLVDTSYSSHARVPWGRCWWPLSGRALLDLDGVLDPDPARPDHPRADAAATL